MYREEEPMVNDSLFHSPKALNFKRFKRSADLSKSHFVYKSKIQFLIYSNVLIFYFKQIKVASQIATYYKHWIRFFYAPFISKYNKHYAFR